MVTIHWNERVLQRALRSAAMKNALEHHAEAIADRVRAQRVMVEGIPGDVELPVDVRTREDIDGLEAAVLLNHPAGLATQAKDGVLTKAASSLGLEVH